MKIGSLRPVTLLGRLHGAGSVAGDVIEGNPVDPRRVGVNAFAGAGGGLATIGLGKLGYGTSGVDTFKQMPVAYPRTWDGAFNYSQKNSAGLWNTGFISNLIGSIPSWIPAL